MDAVDACAPSAPSAAASAPGEPLLRPLRALFRGTPARSAPARSAPVRAALVRAAVLAAGVLGAAGASAWSNHALGSGPALAALPPLVALAPVTVESLESFLAAEGARLEALLDDEERWAREHVPTYPPRPEALRYTVAGAVGAQGVVDAGELRRRFVAAVRIAPDARLALYLQRGPAAPPADARAPLPARAVSTLAHEAAMATTRFVALHAGEAVAPIEVLGTASDEPDYGLDLGLWEDNGTLQGRIYGFGRQPFGNPALAFGSQAPFHMGFYHESWIVYAAAGFLKRTYPEYRIHLWRTLARHALATGHDYWGWRFAGWAVHYLQDLTQPYHARVLPGVATVRMLWINALYLAGRPLAREHAVTLVSNRHLVLENFQRTAMLAAALDRAHAALLFDALAGDAAAAPPAYDDDMPRRLVSRRAAEAADAIDRTIAASFPAHDVDDPAFDFGASEHGIDLDAVLARDNARARQAVLRALAPRLADFGVYTRAFVRSLLPAR